VKRAQDSLGPPWFV